MQTMIYQTHMKIKSNWVNAFVLFFICFFLLISFVHLEFSALEMVSKEANFGSKNKAKQRIFVEIDINNTFCIHKFTKAYSDLGSVSFDGL